MKKILLILLSLIICISACACGDEKTDNNDDNIEQSETEERETIDIRRLINDLENQAKAETNIGKATTLFVRVTAIYSDYCDVEHVFDEVNSSKVYMKKDSLASLNRNQLCAISAVVDSVDATGSVFSYVFKDGNLASMKQFDEYFKTCIAYYKSIASTKADLSATIFHYNDLIKQYMNIRGEYFKASSEQETNELLVGSWICEKSSYQFEIIENLNYIYYPKCTFYEDGTSAWGYLPKDAGAFQLQQKKFDYVNGTWNVQNGKLRVELERSNCYQLESGEASLYVILDNVIFYNSYVYVKQTDK